MSGNSSSSSRHGFFKEEKINEKIKTLGAILMMAEHISEVHKTLGSHDQDHSWKNIKIKVLEVLDLADDSYENIKEYILETIYSGD